MVTVGFFIIMDWTGSAASHTKAIIARNKGDMDEYEKHRIKAPKLLLPYLNLFLYTSG
jgi:hypothetical protein